MQRIAAQLPYNRDVAVVEDLMNRTFPERRALITRGNNGEPIKITHLKEVYPLLDIHSEFKRLTGGGSAFEQLMNGLGAIEDRVMDLKPLPKESPFLTNLRDNIKNEDAPERRSCKY